MILQALTEHYEDLIKRGDLPPEGLGKARVSYALHINDAGDITDVVPTKKLSIIGKKRKIVPAEMVVPRPADKTSNVCASFLTGNSSYLLGRNSEAEKQKDEKTKQRKLKRVAECFDDAKSLHHQVLENVKSPAAAALLSFWDKWDPSKAGETEALKENWDELMSGVNMVFRYNGKFCHEYPEIIEAWMEYYIKNNSDEYTDGVCMVTGRKAKIQSKHPFIKGVKDAQPSGAALVSFNKPAFCSYGKEQSYNAPVGHYAACAYTAALNHLISDREHTFYMGNTLVLYWAHGADRKYADCLTAMMLGNDEGYSAEDIMGFMERLSKMQPIIYKEEKIDPQTDFYILGISPNSGRLSVRFFLRNSFGSFISNINEHYKRMEIVRPKWDKFPYVPVWVLLDETVSPKSKNKKADPGMAGDVARSILSGVPYPATLLTAVTLRIRAEHDISRAKAGIIKAYYSKNKSRFVPEEVLKVSLNPESKSVSYQLGRLFAILENIQEKANPKINATIKDKYFNSASSMPAAVFPTLINLSQTHLRKLGRSSKGLQIALEKEMTEVMGRFGETFPKRMNLPEQGAFQLGYYHQTQERYRSKKEEK